MGNRTSDGDTGNTGDKGKQAPAMTLRDAARLTCVAQRNVFAWRDHGDFVRVVTVDGQKVEAAKK